MDSENGFQSSAESLADRLNRLAVRRQQAAQWQSPAASFSSEDEADHDTGMPLPRSAMQALKDLLQHRGAVLQPADSEAGSAVVAEPLFSGNASSDEVGGQESDRLPGEAMVHSTGQMNSDSEASTSSGSRSSMPPTARRLFAIHSGIGREAASADSQLRAMDIQDAAAALQGAQVQLAELDTMLLRQAAAAAERERLRLEREVELRGIQMEYVTQHMAAWRIGRSWRHFLMSPGRLCKVAAATCIQAAWRGSTSRRRTGAMLQCSRQQQALLVELHAAVEAREQQHARHAAAHLDALGYKADAAQALAVLEQHAADAAQALRTAAATGTSTDYQKAAAEAARFDDLEAMLQQAAGMFEARVASATQALNVAVEGAPFSEFKDALAAAAALGSDTAMLRHAQERVAQRNQQASVALQVAVEASPFSLERFDHCLQHAQRLGLHADVARAKRALQLRQHKTTGHLLELAASGGAAEVEAACLDANQLGLHAEAQAAYAGLEQRQAAALKELHQAAHRGTLQQYTIAAAEAERLGASAGVRQGCEAELRQRQQELEHLLREASMHSDVAVVERHCKDAASLGLNAAMCAAEEQVSRRRQLAVEQLSASTRTACEYASRQASPNRNQAGVDSKQLESWLAGTQQLSVGICELGAKAALLHPPAACTVWPAELRSWLIEAQQVAGLELQAPVTRAVGALELQLQNLVVASRLVAIPLRQPCTGSGHNCTADVAQASGAKKQTSSSTSSGPGASSGRNCDSSMASQPAEISPGACRWLDCYQAWQAMQQSLLPMVQGAAHRLTAGMCGAGRDEEGELPELNLSMQGLNALQLLAERASVASLNVSNNFLRSLEALSALRSLRELKVAANQLTSLQGIQNLSQLTLLDASNNRLDSLPSLAGLTALRHLDLCANHITSAALAAADLAACGSHLTCLRISDNHLTDIPSWMGPLPSLVHLDVSGNSIDGLGGLAEAAPLLQVLIVSGNAITRLPPTMHLPLLRELWLSGNPLAAVAPSWPWLPSLQELHLADYQLTSLAPMQSFVSLHTVDLSFNHFCHLDSLLASLKPLGSCLLRLKLNDDPFAEHLVAEQHLQEVASAEQPASGYSPTVLKVLPRLCELHDQHVTCSEQQQHVWATAVWQRQSLARAAAGADLGGTSVDAAWDAQTILWVLGYSDAVVLAQQSWWQQTSLAAAEEETRQQDSPDASKLAAALVALQKAAEAGLGVVSWLRPPKPVARRSTGINSDSGGLLSLRQMQQQYLVLASGGAAAAQHLPLLNPAYYQRLMHQVHAAASVIQREWRCYRAHQLRQQWAAQRQADRLAAAAACIQATWRGWSCRHLHSCWVQHRLVIWRQQWHEAQQQLLLHQQCCAAIRIQAAWRGWQVRNLLAQARLALHLEHEQQRQGRRGSSDSLELDVLETSLGRDAALEAEAMSLFDSPEVLFPELAATRMPPATVAPTSSSSAHMLPALRASQQNSQRRCPQGMIAADISPSGPVMMDNAAAQLLVTNTLEPRQAEDQDEWQFTDPNTAAAFAAMRQRRQVVARRREQQQQKQDPEWRLQRFQIRNGRASGTCRRTLQSNGSSRASGPAGTDHTANILPGLSSPMAGACRPAAGSQICWNSALVFSQGDVARGFAPDFGDALVPAPASSPVNQASGRRPSIAAVQPRLLGLLDR